ncbi:MAG: hypothetical protein ACTHK2_13850 [Dokdonella sp.]|uniref:hypothetical protein n=1 Tax=Dokdonella sp. TaxID=2291710 RepID=UPI003F8183A9
MTAHEQPATATFREFADLIKRKPSYVTQLRQADRLVLTEDGKRVRVAESIARIEATRDPSRIGTVARHAQARGEDGPTIAGGDIEGEDEASAQDARDPKFQASRAMRENYLALAAKRDYEREIGLLMDAADVESAIASASTQLRRTLEQLPDNLAPRLAAESDEARIRSIMAEEIHHALQELAREFAAIAKGGSGA